MPGAVRGARSVRGSESAETATSSVWHRRRRPASAAGLQRCPVPPGPRRVCAPGATTVPCGSPGARVRPGAPGTRRRGRPGGDRAARDRHHVLGLRQGRRPNPLQQHPEPVVAALIAAEGRLTGEFLGFPGWCDLNGLRALRSHGRGSGNCRRNRGRRPGSRPSPCARPGRAAHATGRRRQRLLGTDRAAPVAGRLPPHSDGTEGRGCGLTPSDDATTSRPRA